MSDTDKGLGSVLLDRVAAAPAKTALRFLAQGEAQTEAVTYEALHARAARLAHALAAQQPAGSRALLVYDAGIDFVVAFWACVQAGIVAVPVPLPKPNRSLHWYLWMHVKSIIGSHGANFREAYEANRLACLGKIHPTVSHSYPLEQAAEAVALVKENRHVGKLGVLCLAQAEGMGIRNPQMRERIGEERLHVFRRHHARMSAPQAAPLRAAA